MLSTCLLLMKVFLFLKINICDITKIFHVSFRMVYIYTLYIMGEIQPCLNTIIKRKYFTLINYSLGKIPPRPNFLIHFLQSSFKFYSKRKYCISNDITFFVLRLSQFRGMYCLYILGFFLVFYRNTETFINIYSVFRVWVCWLGLMRLFIMYYIFNTIVLCC